MQAGPVPRSQFARLFPCVAFKLDIFYGNLSLHGVRSGLSSDGLSSLVACALFS